MSLKKTAFVIATLLSSASPMWNSSQASEVSTQLQNFNVTQKAFQEAYSNGDIDTLNRLKSTSNFGNINDLGEPFSKYGAGMDGWNQLITDAKLNGDALRNAKAQQGRMQNLKSKVQTTTQKIKNDPIVQSAKSKALEGLGQLKGAALAAKCQLIDSNLCKDNDFFQEVSTMCAAYPKTYKNCAAKNEKFNKDNPSS